MNSNQILEREFLEIRAKILEVAAALDRIDRAAGDVGDESKLRLIAEAIELVGSASPDMNRAEQIQLLFSREYNSQWQTEFEIATRV